MPAATRSGAAARAPGCRPRTRPRRTRTPARGAGGSRQVLAEEHRPPARHEQRVTVGEHRRQPRATVHDAPEGGAVEDRGLGDREPDHGRDATPRVERLPPDRQECGKQREPGDARVATTPPRMGPASPRATGRDVGTCPSTGSPRAPRGWVIAQTAFTERGRRTLGAAAAGRRPRSRAPTAPGFAATGTTSTGGDRVRGLRRRLRDFVSIGTKCDRPCRELRAKRRFWVDVAGRSHRRPSAVDRVARM